MENDLAGRCHCGAVGFRLTERLDAATICNCSICRRYGTIWAHGWLGRDIWLDDPNAARVQYRHGDREIGFHHCGICGCITDWTGLETDGVSAAARIRIAVNLRLADPALVAAIPLRRFDGAGAFEELPVDGRCIADIVV